MKNLIKYSFLLTILFISASLSAQKFGYINTQILIQEIPEVKQANAELETIKTQYEKQGQDKISSLQTKYAALERKQAQGEISPKQLEIEAQALKQEEADIAKFGQESEQSLLQKSESLLKPIRDKIQAAIDDVAKENGYTYIFDQSMGILLYADATADVTALVKAKLGM